MGLRPSTFGTQHTRAVERAPDTASMHSEFVGSARACEASGGVIGKDQARGGEGKTPEFNMRVFNGISRFVPSAFGIGGVYVYVCE